MFYKETNFKDTLIGKIPKEWEIVRLKEIAEVIMGQSPPSSTYNKEGVGLPFLQGKMEFGEIFPKPLVWCSEPIKVAEMNDILISVRAPVGDVNLAPYRLCIGRGLAAIRFNSERANYRFYFYYLQKIKKFLENLGKGSTFKAITKEDLEDLKIVHAHLSEQHNIAEVLSVVDSAIELVDKIIWKTERLKKALMQTLLTRGIGHKEFKETEIGKIPKAWQIVKLGEIAEMKRGFSYRSSDLCKYITSYRFLTINDYEKEGGLKISAEPIYLREDIEIDNDFFVKPNDLFIANTDMSKGFIIGAPLWIKGISNKIVYSMDLTKLIIDRNKVRSGFLFYLLCYEKVRQLIKSMAQGTNVLHLNHNLVKLLPIPLPSLSEQEKIAEILSIIDEKLVIERNEKVRLERIKQGLMDLLLTGKVRIKVS